MQKLAQQAIESLREWARAFGVAGDMRLTNTVLDDGLISDLFEDVADPQLRGGFLGALARVEATTGVLQAVCQQCRLIS